MSSQNVVSVANLALLSIGGRAQISSLTEGTTQSNACATLFQFVFESLARTAWWNALRKQATLSLLAAAIGTPENQQGTTLPLPPSPWLYSYAYPSDCLKFRAIIPTLNIPSTGTPLTGVNNTAGVWLPSGGQIKFAIAYSTDASGNPITVILTNQTQAQGIYTVNQPNPSIWDSQFTSAMVASLATYLVPALSLNAQLMQGQISNAERLIAEARTSDANEAVTVQDNLPDWIRARGVGGFNTYLNNYNSEYGFGNMSWPAVT